jgi:tetratricopeptide (TPR) repeat protein
MSHDEATELLAVRLGPTQHIGVNDRMHLIELCGGLPLMITLLAEHIASSSAADLSKFAQQLDTRQLIADIGEDGDSSTVARTFFSWSYRALDMSEQRLFRLLGLHPGPEVGVDLACACDGRTPTETKRSFGILVGAHLLERPDAFDRYRFHDLLREFAAYCAAQDEPLDARQTAERRIVSYYLATATRAHQLLYHGKPTAPALPIEVGVEPTVFQNAGQARHWYEQERTNLTAAINRAAACGNHQYAWRLADTVATYLDRHGAYEDSRTIRELAVTSAAATGDQEATASSQAGLGMVLINLGEHTQARQCLDTSLRFAVDNGNERGQASALYHLGKLEMSRGDRDAAIDCFQRCLDIAQRGNDHDALCWTHCSLGQVLRAIEQHDAALTHLHQGLFHAQHIGDKSAYAANLVQIGAIHQDRGDYQAATAYCEQALVELADTPNMAITAQVRTRLAEIDLGRGDAKAAQRRALHALEECQRTHDAAAEASLLEVLGNAHASLGDTLDAIKVWQRAAHLHDRVGNTARSAVMYAHVQRASAGDDTARAAHLRRKPASSDG